MKRDNPSGWFKDATEPRTQLKERARPKWYSAVIVAHIGVKKVFYAGREWTEHVYQVH